jgi:GAF domain-containing protein
MDHVISTPSEIKPLASERLAFLELLQAANRLIDPAKIRRNILILARHFSGCEAVAIRLKTGPGYPFADTLGFPEAFLDPEDDLCVRDAAGHLMRDHRHEPIPACLCGRLLRGQVDLAQPQFTERGSFILSPNRELHLSQLETQLLGHTLNPHHVAGYASVGIFPIRMHQQPCGLLQCNDRRPGRLQGEIIELMENLAARAGDLFELTMP